MIEGFLFEELFFHLAGAGGVEDVAGWGCGVEGGSGTLREGEEESEQSFRGYGASVEDGGAAEAGGTSGGEGKATIRLDLQVRRVRIIPEERRGEYIRRLEEIMKSLDAIINDPTGIEEIQIKAINALVTTVRTCYSMVREMDVEHLEKQLKRLKQENENRKRLLYEIEKKE